MTRRIHVRVIAVVAVAGIAAACSRDSKTAHRKDRSDAAATISQREAAMQKHFGHIQTIVDAVVAGDVHATRAPATWLAEHGGPPSAPPAWSPYTKKMRGYASEVVAAKAIETAAAAAGKLGGTCGTCHAATGASLVMTKPTLVIRPDDDVATRMRRHKWAVDRLWQGLVGPDDKSWTAGAQVLRAVPLTVSDAAEDGKIPVDIVKWVETTHALGEEALKVSVPDERATLVGKLLGTCAACHDLTR